MAHNKWRRQRPAALLAAVEKASKDQAAAAARIPPLTFVLNTVTLIITAVLGMAIGVLIMALHQTHVDQEQAKMPEVRLARDLATIRGRLGYGVSEDGRSMMLRVYPGRTWKVRSAQTDEQGSATITLYDPTAEAYENKQYRLPEEVIQGEGATNDELVAGVNKSVDRLRSEMEELKTMQRSTWIISLLLAWLAGILTHIGFNLVFH